MTKSIPIIKKGNKRLNYFLQELKGNFFEKVYKKYFDLNLKFKYFYFYIFMLMNKIYLFL